MRTILFALPLLAVSCAIGHAQTQTETQSPTPAQAQPRISYRNLTPQQLQALTKLAARKSGADLVGNCPVGMTAQQRASGQTVWTTALEDAANPRNLDSLRPGNTGVHVELNAHGKSSIHQAELAVYFMAPRTRVLPVVEADALPAQKKTFNLATDRASLKLMGDLLVGPAASITRVQLLSLTYADGTTWSARSDSPCSVEPDRFILVDAR